MKKILISGAAFFVCLICIACKTKEPVLNSDSLELNVKDCAEVELSKTAPWNFSQEKICVLFGYGFNSEEFLKGAKAELGIKFGLEENGGLILPLVFPNDFKSGVRTRINNFAELVSQVQLKGIILLGAPENTHTALNIIKNQYDGTFPFPVFSFFPQDNVLGMEWISDFVLEKLSVTDLLAEMEQGAATMDDVLPLLENAITYMNCLEGPLPANQDLILHVQKIAGTSRKVSRYVDPDSGIRSANHFVFQEK